MAGGLYGPDVSGQLVREGNKVHFEDDYASGVVTYHEDQDQRVLHWEGWAKEGGGSVSIDVEPWESYFKNYAYEPPPGIPAEDIEPCHLKADGQAKYEVAQRGEGIGGAGLIGALIHVAIVTEVAEDTYSQAMRDCLCKHGHDVPYSD